MSDTRALFNAALRTDFPTFLAKACGDLFPGDKFLPNWHHDAIGWRLKQVAECAVTRLVVTIPPRHLKSNLISVAWVAWMLGNDPTLRFIVVSYNNDLSGTFARDCRNIMQAGWYCRAFPGTVLRRASESDLETTRGGGRLSTSIGGTLTGRGGDIIIIDDPLKADDAMSASARTGVNDWISSTLFSRLNNKATGRIILVMQRLHDDDVAGMLLRAGGWEHLNLPAIAEDDEEVPVGLDKVHLRTAGTALHEEREPLDVLMRMKAAMGSSAFSAQYQQAPVPISANLVDPAWFRRYEQLPTKQAGDRIVQAWDTATKDGVLNDYSVCVTALVRGRVVYIVDLYRRKMKFPELKHMVGIQAAKHDVDVLLIEDAASGQQLIQMLVHEHGSGGPLPIACKAESDKVTRLSAVSSMIESGSLVLPREASWLAEFERELIAFPAGRHDDQVDALSQLLNWVARQPKLLRLSFAIFDEMVSQLWPC